MSPRTLKLTFLAVAFLLAVLMYVGTPSLAASTASDVSAQDRFTWIYAEVVIDEALLFIALMTMFGPVIGRRLNSVLAIEIRLSKPTKVLAAAALAVGLFFFGFWAIVDLLGGYGGPGYTFSNYPFLDSIYSGLGLSSLPISDEQGKVGFISLCVSVVGFMALRAGEGLRTALREGLCSFASPILITFELVLWCVAPADMYWHVTSFLPWSIGSYLTNSQFASLTQSGDFVWGGGVFLASNWFVLLAAIITFTFGNLPTRGYHQTPNPRQGLRAEERSTLVPCQASLPQSTNHVFDLAITGMSPQIALSFFASV
ncbi:MAG TPA: hypothetical protein VEC08_01360 [Nitrososphaerales archaeon]|nr:hypothetical protein [Nitrososphaerales archaeon]